jgi:integrase
VTPYNAESIGKIANDVAARHVFAEYTSRKARNTITRQHGDLVLFDQYLAEVGIEAGDLAHDPAAWRPVTWGLVSGFVQWQIKKGYAVGSINVRLSTVKKYCTLALKAGALAATEHALIRTVEGYRAKEAKSIDENRQAAGVATRAGHKKAESTKLTKAQADQLKAQPDTPQGRRDRLLMCLLLDLGLRVGEVARLTVDCFNLKDGTLTFYRPKVNKTQTHNLINGSLVAARAYIAQDAPAIGVIWRQSRKDGRLHEATMSERRLSGRVAELGRRIGVDGLSAHDCRHYWATLAARHGTPIDRLMDGGGWSSPAMPMRYVEAAAVANSGIILE